MVRVWRVSLWRCFRGDHFHCCTVKRPDWINFQRETKVDMLEKVLET